MIVFHCRVAGATAPSVLVKRWMHRDVTMVVVVMMMMVTFAKDFVEETAGVMYPFSPAAVWLLRAITEHKCHLILQSIEQR